MKYSVALVDLDDTLLDFGAASELSLAALLESYGHSATPEKIALYKKINALCWHKFEMGEITRDRLSTLRFELFFKETGTHADPLEAHHRFLEGLANHPVLIPGAVEMCRRLSEMAELYIVTNGFAETQQRRLDLAGLSGFIRGRFTSQAIGFSKPDVRFFEAVFKAIGPEKKKEAIILGDSISSDIKGGFDFGIATCFYNPKGLPADPICDHVITSLEQFIPQVMLAK